MSQLHTQFKLFKRFKKAGLTFPKDPDYVDRHIRMDDPWAKRGQKMPSSKDLSKPYRHASLKALSNADIVRYMGDGNSISELKWANVLKTHIPTNFWTLDPKSAALATADANRYPVHQKCFRLAVDDRDGRKPPDTCSISFTYVSDRSYNAVDRHYFLRADPQRSYLAYARSWAGGVVFYNVVHDQPAFDFRFCEMSYGDARHFAHTIWWLNRVRSHSVVASEGVSMMHSSADGMGRLVIRQEGGDDLVMIAKTMWAGLISERWRADFTPEVCLNLASFLIADALPARLGDQWSRFEPKHSQGILARRPSAPQYEQEELKRIRTLTGTFLDLFSSDQTSISFAIVREAARAAGGFAYTNLAAKLAGIRAGLPVEGAPKRTEAEIRAEIEEINAVKPDDKGWENAMEKRTALFEELMALYRDTDVDSVQALRDSISLSMRQLQCADDPNALQEWAISREPGCQWALQRLKDRDRKRYVAALEWWMRNSKEKWARQAFEAVAAEDSERAAEIAKGIPPRQKGDLAVSAFAHLAEVDRIPDEQQRIKALIDVALDPGSGWEERGRAIELLVPPDQPLRYQARDVDAALVKLLSPEMADDVINFTLGRACRGLARRGRTEYFDKIERVLESADVGTIYSEVLGSLAHLAQCDPAKYNPRLLAILKPQLKKTNKRVPDLLMAVWSADLRGLAPDLESIATATPDDYEDEKAHSCGGEESAIEGRLHLARQILSLWNEEDALTRCRLLLAFGFNHAFELFEEQAPERLTRMRIELDKTAQKLTRDERKAADGFLRWYQDEHINKEDEPAYRGLRAKFAALARTVLNLPLQ